jgi:DNA-binding NarL/FixJ family response regulator
MRVLIVDDSQIVCQSLQQMLINVADVEIACRERKLKQKSNALSETKEGFYETI